MKFLPHVVAIFVDFVSVTLAGRACDEHSSATGGGRSHDHLLHSPGKRSITCGVNLSKCPMLYLAKQSPRALIRRELGVLQLLFSGADRMTVLGVSRVPTRRATLWHLLGFFRVLVDPFFPKTTHEISPGGPP